MRPTFGSLFSGIGGFDLGLERAGWRCVGQVEIDDWRRQILARHWPDVPRWGDVREFCVWPDKQEGREDLAPAQGDTRTEQGRWPWSEFGVDLICGGFPCQDLSVAGKRAGLKGERSGLWWEFTRIAAALRPTWLLIENVPGLLTASKGHDFAVVVDTLADFGYGLAWRILDSQHFGVPQRRRRVYIVGHLGAPCPSEILFEPEGGGGDTQAGREEANGTPFGTPNGLAHALSRVQGGNDYGANKGTLAYALADNTGNRTGSGRDGQDTFVCPPPDADGVREATGVPRWLDPCPRCPDGRRYAALGDAVTVNVIEWIGRRLYQAHRRRA